MSEDDKKVEFGRYAKGYDATPRNCDMCHKMYIPEGWEKRETSMPETYPRMDFNSARCRERSFEICGDCVYKIISFIEDDHKDYDALKKIRDKFKVMKNE